MFDYQKSSPSWLYKSLTYDCTWLFVPIFGFVAKNAHQCSGINGE